MFTETFASFIRQWQRATFPDATAQSAARHMRREARELVNAADRFAELEDCHPAREPRLRNVSSTEYFEARTHLAQEVADVVILAVAIADRAGFSLEDAIRDKMLVNVSRRWGEPDAEGVTEHVRGSA